MRNKYLFVTHPDMIHVESLLYSCKPYFSEFIKKNFYNLNLLYSHLIYVDEALQNEVRTRLFQPDDNIDSAPSLIVLANCLFVLTDDAIDKLFESKDFAPFWKQLINHTTVLEMKQFVTYFIGYIPDTVSEQEADIIKANIIDKIYLENPDEINDISFEEGEPLID